MTQETAVRQHQAEDDLIQLVPVADIQENGNVRQTYDERALAELTASVKHHGILQPLLLRRRLEKGKTIGYSIVAGHRRFRAAVANEHMQVPAIVRDIPDDELVEIQLIENVQREDIHPLEESEAFWKLLMEQGVSHGEIARRIGKSTGYVFDRIQLHAKLIDEAKKYFRAGTIRLEHAIILARLRPADQKTALTKPTYDDRNSPLFRMERTIFEGDRLTAKSPRELQSWVDEHVRFTTMDSSVVAELFPQTVAQLEKAQMEKIKVVPIIKDHQMKMAARDGATRTFTPQTYKAVGKAKCDYQVLGLVVAGTGRGETFMVCTRKDVCTTHWKEEIAAKRKAMKSAAKAGGDSKSVRAAARKAEEDAYEIRRKEEEARRERWAKAVPTYLKAIAAKVQMDPITAKSAIGRMWLPETKRETDAIAAHVKFENTADGIIRFTTMERILNDVNWRGHAERWAKLFGVDLDAIEAEVHGEKPAAPKVKKASKKK